ncbi:MAG: F0F1 ATP synthase subunit B [Candidatus Nomurabacteria bacterium]|nr:MAG: F0F1 ATP synthase subunit B [Candidatus Nomurabacteria bacterium]
MLDILQKIGFDWQVALANLINFLIVFYLIKRFFLKKITSVIDERKQKIEEGLEDAEKSKSLMLEAENEKSAILKEANQKVGEILKSAETRGEEIVAKNKIEGEKSREKIIEEGKESIKQEKEKVLGELKKNFLETLVGGIESVSSVEVSQEKAEKYTEEMLKKI